MISNRFKTNLSAMVTISGLLLSTIIQSGGAAYAASDNDCSQLPTYSELKAALTTARNARQRGI